MSCILAHTIKGERAKVALEQADADSSGNPVVSNDLDFEALDFAQRLLALVEALDEGEALVVWKEIY